MLNRIRDRFGTAGLVVSIMALVLALAGGAFAAAGGLTAKEKKQVKAIAKGLVPTGPVGPAGLAGPAGANGANGAKGDTGAKGDRGDPGTNGTNGTSVTSTPEAPGPNCTNGGVKFTSASPASYACNGANGAPGAPGARGDPWTAGGTLPDGATETGTWSLATTRAGAPDLGAPFPPRPIRRCNFIQCSVARSAAKLEHPLRPLGGPGAGRLRERHSRRYGWRR